MIRTDRDFELLQKLGNYGILSTGQVAGIFFSGVQPTTVRRRLRILEKAKLIYRVQGLDDGGVGWTLTRLAAEAIGVHLQTRYFNRNSLKHDVILSDVRLTLEKVGIARNWIPEHTLKSRSKDRFPGNRDEGLVPDALFSVTSGTSPKVVALELELHGKNQKRYEKILSKYLRMKSVWAVWYLVPSASLGKTLEVTWRRLTYGRRNDLLIWSLLPEVLAYPGQAWINSEHFRLRLGEVMKVPTKPALGAALPESNGKEVQT